LKILHEGGPGFGDDIGVFSRGGSRPAGGAWLCLKDQPQPVVGLEAMALADAPQLVPRTRLCSDTV